MRPRQPDLPQTTGGGDHWREKEVPRNLFSFEEKIWGMTLSQLLSDLFSGMGLFLLTSSLPPLPRLILCAVSMLLVVTLVHGRIHGQSLLALGRLLLRFRFLPRLATWQAGSPDGKAREKQPHSIQQSWINMSTLRSGIAGNQEMGRYWAVLEVVGRQTTALSEAEQERIYTLFETVLAGLNFRLQWLTLVEQEQAATSLPLSRYRAAAQSRHASLPHLHQLALTSIAFQARHLRESTRLAHFVVVQVDRAEETARSSTEPSALVSTLLSGVGTLFGRPATESALASEHALLGVLGSRLTLIKKRLGQLDIQARPLSDQAVLKLWVRTLSPGIPVPSFLRVPEETGRSRKASKQGQIAGLHPGSLTSVHAQGGTLTGEQIADLLAPSQVTLAPDSMEIRVGTHTRYLRFVFVSGYGHHRQAGWMRDLTSLGVPMILSEILDPLERPYLQHRLDMQLVRLESRKLADQKAMLIGDAARDLEAEQIRGLSTALAAQRLQVFSTQLVIGLHAGSRERLEQRTRYVLAQLRQCQLEVESALLRQDQAWKSCLPTCQMTVPALSTLLGSDVLSTFLHADNGTIGTKTGAFLGWTGEGQSRRPVYLNPWSEGKANPHIVIVGDTGQGKSYTGKVLVLGLLSLGLADVVVYDKDDDYLPLHQALKGESQRYDLARGCPINLFDLPFSREDCSDPDDTSDLLAEYIDNHLLTGLALLVCEPGQRLSKGEEASLMLAARATYASRGITSESLRRDPEIVLSGTMPTLSDFLATMRGLAACDKTLLERLERASYLFAGQTRMSLETPLTIFSIRELDEKYYALMSFVVQTFLRRHRAQRRNTRYLAYVVEEASYLLKHPAGRAYLESGSRGFRKLGIAQITLSQHPREFLEEGAVILSNAGTAFFLGMQREAAERLRLPNALERTLIEAIPGQAVMRNGAEYAAITIAAPPAWQQLLTTNPRERRVPHAFSPR